MSERSGAPVARRTIRSSKYSQRKQRKRRGTYLANIVSKYRIKEGRRSDERAGSVCGVDLTLEEEVSSKK